MSTSVGDTTLLRAPNRRRRPDARARHPSMARRRHHPAAQTAEQMRPRQVRRQLEGVALDEFRLDVEGLRAVAVVAVLLFHLRIDVFSGGFVGVDVFFVVSGFLITRLLLRELAATGDISLPNFWARRARRLLPASVFVLIVTVVASRWMLSPVAQRTLASDAMASGGFVGNFVFANRLGDYFESQMQPSALLHFWSLAVEEQFYLVWPVVLVVAARRPRQYRRLVLVIIVGAAAASFLLSVWLTDRQPTWAFYLLPTRMGELLAGAALAAAGPAFSAVNASFRAALGWFGLFAIAVAVFTYDAGTVFPGYASLLPVLGTVLIIVAGGSGSSMSGPATALRHPAAQWVGKHSYAIYLWHWPALVLFDAKFGPLGLPIRVAVVAFSVGLAAVSLRLIEDPVRRSSWLAFRPNRGLALGGALCAIALGVGWMSQASAPPLDSGRAAAAPTLPFTPTQTPPVEVAVVAPTSLVAGVVAAPTTSAASVPVSLAPLVQNDLATLVSANQAVLEQGLTATDVPSNLRPSLGSVGADRAEVYGDDCVAIGVDTELTPCRYGPEGAAVTVVLYGDSHAAQWAPPLIDMANDRNFELVVLAKGGCPVAAVSIPTATLARTCPIWRDAAVEFIAAAQPEVVIVSAWADYPNDDDEWSSGFSTTMSRLAPLTSNLVVLGDNPPTRREPATCLSDNLGRADACAAERTDVVMASRLTIERDIAAGLGAMFIDTTDWLCTQTACPVIIGDILLYRDVSHITTFAARWFRPLLEASLESALP